MKIGRYIYCINIYIQPSSPTCKTLEIETSLPLDSFPAASASEHHAFAPNNSNPVNPGNMCALATNTVSGTSENILGDQCELTFIHTKIHIHINVVYIIYKKSYSAKIRTANEKLPGFGQIFKLYYF